MVFVRYKVAHLAACEYNIETQFFVMYITGDYDHWYNFLYLLVFTGIINTSSALLVFIGIQIPVVLPIGI